MANEAITKGLGLGVYTIPSDPELIPAQAAQDSLGWISTDGKVELCRGRLLIGTEETDSSSSKGLHIAYRADGTSVMFRKFSTKIQYYNTTTLLWVDCVTGLTASADYTFANYTSLAGAMVFVTGVDGIYKIMTANPASFTSLYDSTKNFKGKSIIVTGRMHMWDLPNDKTGHYGSHIDPQDSTVYTTVTNETIGTGDAATTSFSGTLAFKGGGATRTCFGVTVTVTGGEVLTDDYNGNLTGTLGATGTINYTSGAWAITFVTPPAAAANNIKATYQWENSNALGITDFTESGTRLAGEGFVFRQDEGGDAIQVIHTHNGRYYSLKSNSAYELNIAVGDLTATNLVFRKNLGMQYWRSSVVTGLGIVFMDTANRDKPQLTILQQNITGDNLEPAPLAPQFDFSNYTWDMCAMTTFGEFIIFSGRTSDSSTNNKLFLYNVRRKTIDILPYRVKTIVEDKGALYSGDTLTDNVYQLLSGFDDDDDTIENYWIGHDEMYGTESLKKLKRYRIKGVITPDQSIGVYFSPDGDTFTQIGTVLGDGTYVDFINNFTIGSSGIGESGIGGETDTLDGAFYLCELKLSQTKFRKRTIKLVALGIGYVSVTMMDDFKIQFFQQKLPARYRSKQNVSLDGTLTNQ